MKTLLIAIVLVLAPISIAYPQHEELFSFGVIADVQYADAEKAGKRDYRSSLGKLEICIKEFNNHNLFHKAFRLFFDTLSDPLKGRWRQVVE